MKMESLNDMSVDGMSRVICAFLNTCQLQINRHPYGLGMAQLLLFLLSIAVSYLAACQQLTVWHHMDDDLFDNYSLLLCLFSCVFCTMFCLCLMWQRFVSNCVTLSNVLHFFHLAFFALCFSCWYLTLRRRRVPTLGCPCCAQYFSISLCRLRDVTPIE